MKLVKMSLAAAVLLGASAFAIDNVKVSGDAKLFYYTDDTSNGMASEGLDVAGLDTGSEGGFFDKGNSAADTALRLGVTADLAKGISMGATGYAVSTLGLENNLVSNTWTGAHGATFNGSNLGAAVDDQAWMGELWLAATMGKTTAKLGRMELDTPFAFSEKWSIVPNTFEAAVLINQDLPDTTLVGAWVGKGNGGPGTLGLVGIDLGVVQADAEFTTFGVDGAYAAGIVNNSFKPATVQAWYYNVVNVADAFWLQADINCQLVKGLTIGAQYAEVDTKGVYNANEDSSAYAFKLGYAVDALKVSAAYSSTDENGFLNIQNVATNNGQSKLYTETYWTYGVVGSEGVDAWNLTAEYDAKVAKLGAYYTNAEHDASNGSMDEVAVTASKSFGPLDATLAYVNTDISGAEAVNSIQAYLTLNF